MSRCKPSEEAEWGRLDQRAGASHEHDIRWMHRSERQQRQDRWDAILLFEAQMNGETWGDVLRFGNERGTRFWVHGDVFVDLKV